MTPDEYQTAALRTEKLPEAAVATTFLPLRLREFRLLHAGMGLVTEAGEFMDGLKRSLIYGKPSDNENLLEEIGDILWYCSIALDALGTDFDTVMRMNIRKLRQRFPDKYSDDSALNRDLAEERKLLEGLAKNLAK